MNKFIRMPGTDDLVNLDHIVAIYKCGEDEYLVSLTSGSFTLNHNEYLKLCGIICDNGIHTSTY